LSNWPRSLKVGLASVVATVFVLAGSYGVAYAAAPSFFHGRHFPRTLDGTVSAVGTGSFTLQVRHHRSLTVLTTSTTKFVESGSPEPVTGVAVGEHVVVFLIRHHQVPPVTSTTTSTTSTTITTSTTAMTSTEPSASRLTADQTTSPPPLTAAVVYIVLSRESGRVSGVTSSTVTLGGRHDSSRTIDLSSSTAYFEGGKSVTQSALTVGDFITAFGTRTGGGLDAVNVDIFPAHPKTTHKDVKTANKDTRHLWSTAKGAHNSSRDPMGSDSKLITSKVPSHVNPKPVTTATVAGVVKSVSGDTIVVRSFTGATQTVTITSSTTYRDGRGQATLSSVVAGDNIRAYGVSGAGGGLTASVVVIGSRNTGTPHTGWTPSQPQTSRTHTVWTPGSGSPPPSHNYGGSTRRRHH
jgi:Domain of unknown function (DUF5666)